MRKDGRAGEQHESQEKGFPVQMGGEGGSQGSV